MKYRNFLLLGSSLLFYAWGEPKFAILMVLSIIFNFIMGNLIAKCDGRKKLVLGLAIAVDLAVIFIFKYLGFSCRIINAIIETVHLKPLSVINIALPIGISFFTFQEISYLVDVYRDSSMVQKNILNLGLYITFFPQLIAGPIVRYHDINEQIEGRKESVSMFAEGLERFIIGLSKKIILANNFALVCDSIYESNISSYGTCVAWIAAIAYSMQIYYDFSGYSDMAIGLAKMFGFSLLENFNYPYAASSITDFWKRWHISLTSFFRDYVYIPLGGNRKGKKRAAFNRFFVFFLTGLWHGAAFNFIFWGLFHGIAMILERTFKINEARGSAVKIFRRLLTLVVVVFLWVLFRNGMSFTVSLWKKMVGFNGLSSSDVLLPIRFFFLDTKFFVVLLLGIAFSFPWWKKVSVYDGSKAFLIAKYIVLIILFIVSLAFLASNTYNPFIYFRF